MQNQQYTKQMFNLNTRGRGFHILLFLITVVVSAFPTRGQIMYHEAFLGVMNDTYWDSSCPCWRGVFPGEIVNVSVFNDSGYPIDLSSFIAVSNNLVERMDCQRCAP
jgi:hypothetical protein